MWQGNDKKSLVRNFSLNECQGNGRRYLMGTKIVSRTTSEVVTAPPDLNFIKKWTLYWAVVMA